MIRIILKQIKHDKWNRFQMIVLGFQYQIWLNIEQRLLFVHSQECYFEMHYALVN